MNEEHDEPGVQRLEPAMAGIWLVTTQGSRHVWDLERFSYRRLNGANRSRFGDEGVEVPIGRVVWWPAVGERFYLWYDDQENSLVEQYRISSRIVSIVSADADMVRNAVSQWREGERREAPDG